MPENDRSLDELRELSRQPGPKLPWRERGSDARMSPDILRRLFVEAELVEVARANRIRRRAE